MLPCDCTLIKQTHSFESVDNLTESAVAKSASKNLSRVHESVDVLIGKAVSVGISFKRQCLVYLDCCGCIQKLLCLYMELFGIADVDSFVSEGSEGSDRRPGELVPQRVIAESR